MINNPSDLVANFYYKKQGLSTDFAFLPKFLCDFCIFHSKRPVFGGICNCVCGGVYRGVMVKPPIMFRPEKRINCASGIVHKVGTKILCNF
jgi:hypothetical protein